MARRLASILALLLLGTTVHAATLCVNPGGTSGCFASVQGAVDAAVSGDTITIAAGTYVENVLIEGKRLDIIGDDSTTTLIDGGGAGRTVTVRGPGTDLTLSRLGIRNAGPSLEVAGLTVSTSKVTVTECRITGNAGPGVSDDEGSFGGIKRARLTVVDTTIDGNARAGVLLSGQSRATIVRSTMSGNGDSGIFVRGKGSRILVEDSTVSGNGTAIDGGGIYVGFSSAKLVRCTVAANTAQRFGGGVFADAGARVRSAGTILADNVHMAATPNDCALGQSSIAVTGRFISRGFNLIENPCPSIDSSQPDVIGQDPMLGPLQNNGGPTSTHALLAGSPALAVVTRTHDCLESDQRGAARAVPCDLGAYEAP